MSKIGIIYIMPKLIFDIETIGEDFDFLDETTKKSLTHWLSQESESDEKYKKDLENIKNRLGFSPLTGEIVAIGVLDYEQNKGAVYFQALGEKLKKTEENNFSFYPTTEKEMLQKFWELSKNYSEFISFNGRGFDVPFLMIRSAIHKIKPSKDLISNRYLNYQKSESTHMDLFDLLTFYGAVRRRGNLHLWTRAFGIKSPKSNGITGDDVGKLFKEKKFLDIAKYNIGDLIATKELYDYWYNYIKI